MQERISNSLIFGCAGISGQSGGYSFGKIEENKALETLEYAYHQGITIFDNAPIYGMGEAERRLGSALNRYRAEVKYISKAGVDWHHNGRVNMSNDPRIIKKMLEESLKRLNTDYIDIYYIHWPDKNVDIRKAIEVLAKAKREQKIIHIGLSNTSLEEITLAGQVENIEYLQAECNLFNDELIKFEKIKNDFITQGWGTFDKGILANAVKLNRQFDKTDCRSWAPWWKKSNWKEKVKLVENFKADIRKAALSYSLTRSYTHYSIIGFKNKDHIDSVIDTNIDLKLAQMAWEYFHE